MSSARLALGSLVVVLALGGCTLFQPEQREQRPLEVPGAWQQPQPGTPSAAAAFPARWWRAFNDPQLDALIDDALRTNSNLAAAGIRVQRAQLQAGLANTNLTPSVVGQTSTGRSYDLKRGGVAGSSSTSLVTLSYEFDLWGRLAAQRSAADWELKATESDRQATALSLVGTTAGLYWQVGYLNQRIVLSEAGMEDARRILALVRAKYAAGAVSGLDVAQAGQNLASQEAAHTQLLQQRVEARNALAILFDRPPEIAAQEPSQLPNIALPTIDAGLPASLLSRRPDLRAAEQRLRGSLANVDATRTSFYPALSLTGSLGTSSTALGELLKNPVATLGAGLALPFLQWNTARLTVAVSQTQYEEAVLGFRQSLYTALSEVENTLSSRTQLRDESEKLVVALQQAQRAETLSEVRYRAGATALQPVLDAKDRRRSAEISLALNRLNRLNATMTLYKALGGAATE
ncbi:NodT family efflux transporter outer membrane factor (OMF) lipoprotein [Variovorax boronicumulans]|uniref:NodT family efflux transporter outer membrane factor (OMF) lipoprotein n=1 Tax=Variovorax boronicumulans TaxID=436515 RepID=A0AAW8CQ71_9BURK|nr:efflux transporter outer membrane subunit [Variovorax boronicumulans]MDP9891107.1 NodT family efflux transporter outer membrane factor (OMF) lipoprotein [Variovorax boronicumulans]MDQ0051174.1 NodT family efflux transporter outer membrane factor (OMF) lipoprotein [Variovorax boronicumulans]